jgi:hypothetical protein
MCVNKRKRIESAQLENYKRLCRWKNEKDLGGIAGSNTYTRIALQLQLDYIVIAGNCRAINCSTIELSCNSR